MCKFVCVCLFVCVWDAEKGGLGAKGESLNVSESVSLKEVIVGEWLTEVLHSTGDSAAEGDGGEGVEEGEEDEDDDDDDEEEEEEEELASRI